MTTQRIELGAIVVRDGRLWLLRPEPGGPWVLPGGPLLEEHEDTDIAMDAILAALGVNAPAIEEDFLETRHPPSEEGRIVYNIYAASEWTGEPCPPPGVGAGWFGLDELDAISMESWLREALLEVFGLKEPGSRDGDILGALAATIRAEEALSAGEDKATGELPGAAGFRSAISDAWQASELDGRSCGLVAVAALSALGGRPHALREALVAAMMHGATPEDLGEVIRLAGAYAGYPAAIEAWTAMEGLLAERGVPLPGGSP